MDMSQFRLAVVFERGYCVRSSPVRRLLAHMKQCGWSAQVNGRYGSVMIFFNPRVMYSEDLILRDFKSKDFGVAIKTIQAIDGALRCANKNRDKIESIQHARVGSGHDRLPVFGLPYHKAWPKGR